MKRLAIFVSGNGTNLQRIAEYFAQKNDIEVSLVVCNNDKAYAKERAKNLGIPLRMITKAEFAEQAFADELTKMHIDLIVLAGFLWLVPATLITAFHNRIINIHPALLPKYGGKGFYGEHVHQAVVAAKEQFSGITIHYVNEKYDSGDIIFQKEVALDINETADSLAAKIHVLEQENFPVVIEKLLKQI